MGFDPLGVKFVLAVNVLINLSKPAWEKKIEVYQKQGLFEDEIFLAFGKYPLFMMLSEDKIMRVMGLFGQYNVFGIFICYKKTTTLIIELPEENCSVVFGL